MFLLPLKFLQRHFYIFRFFFSFSSRNNGLSLSVRLAAFGINFDRWFILPIKDPSCFSDLGGFRLSIAFVFVILGTTQVGGNLCPSQFTSDWKNSHLAYFNAKFLLSSLLNTSKLVFHAFLSHFETIKIYLRNKMHPERGSACDPWLFENPLAYQPDQRSL